MDARCLVNNILSLASHEESECRSSGILGGVVLNSIIDRRAWIPRASAFNILPERPPTILHRITIDGIDGDL